MNVIIVLAVLLGVLTTGTVLRCFEVFPSIPFWAFITPTFIIAAALVLFWLVLKAAVVG